MKHRVVHCRKAPYDVYIGRPSMWGNPFLIGSDGTRLQVIQKYSTWVKKQPRLMGLLPRLKGKILGCWCAPMACHGTVLVNLADKCDAGKKCS